MAAEVANSKDRIINALVLAFSHSNAKEAVGTDALRMVLSGRYRELTTGGVFDLNAVWDLLADQPDFETDLAKPPLCRFKMWEPQLGMDVTMPPAMAGLTSLEIAAFGEECRVPQSDVDKLFGRGRFAEQEIERRRAARSAEHVVEKKISRPRVDRTGLKIAFVLVGVAALGFAGFTAFQLMRGAQWEQVSKASAGDIPAAEVKRIGPDVGIRLASDDWVMEPAEKRREQLTEVLNSMSNEGTRNLFVRDTTGKLRATAQLYGSPPAIQIRLF